MIDWVMPKTVRAVRYRVNIPHGVDTEIEVHAGKDVVIDLATLGGWVGVKGQGMLGGHVFDLSGKHLMTVDSLNPPGFLAPGRYRIQMRDVRSNEIQTETEFEIKLGEARIFDVTQ